MNTVVFVLATCVALALFIDAAPTEVGQAGPAYLAKEENGEVGVFGVRTPVGESQAAGANTNNGHVAVIKPRPRGEGLVHNWKDGIEFGGSSYGLNIMDQPIVNYRFKNL